MQMLSETMHDLKNCISPHDVFDARTLPEERVDHRRPLWHERGFEEEAEQRQDAVETLENWILPSAECDSLTQFCQDHQIQDDGTGQQRVLNTTNHHHRCIQLINLVTINLSCIINIPAV